VEGNRVGCTKGELKERGIRSYYCGIFLRSKGSMTLPSVLVVLATIIFLVLERMFPGRDLPKAKGWYWRALW